MTPRAVLLDLDDTILNYSGKTTESWEDACSSFASELGTLPPSELLETVLSTSQWYWSDPDRHRVGRLDLGVARQEIVQMSLASAGVENTALAKKIAERYERQRDASIELFPEAIDTIRWLRSCGCRLALLTNGNGRPQRAKIVRFGLQDLFEAILIEGELGFGKPDPRVYEVALRELSVSADETWMVGDNLEWDVTQPQRMGIVGVWVDLHGDGVPESSAVRPDHVVRRLSELRTLIQP